MTGQHHDVVGERQHLGRRGCAASSAWSPPGRSVRPIEPAKSRSPENITSEMSSAAYGERKVTEPSVWPGVWSTTKRRPGQLELLQVRELLDVVRLGELVVAAEQHLAGLAATCPAIGSASRCRSAGWIQAVAS